jgi:hypothetical protein
LGNMEGHSFLRTLEIKIHQVIHKPVKHFKNSQQIHYAMDHGNSYANRKRKVFFKGKARTHSCRDKPLETVVAIMVDRDMLTSVWNTRWTIAQTSAVLPNVDTLSICKII